MNDAESSKQSRALPLVLAVLGIVALVGAILLILQLRSGVGDLHTEYSRAMSNQAPAAPAPSEPASAAAPAEAATAKDAAPMATEEPTEAKAEEPAAEAPVDPPAEPAQPVKAEPEAPAEPDEPKADEPAPEPTDASIGEGKWRFSVQHRPFSVSIAGENAIEDVAQMLLENSESTVLVTGYNNPNFSSKRGMSLARKIRGLITQKGVEQYRIRLEADQRDEVETFSIEIEFQPKGK